jgi:hypothetical protein
MTSGNGKLRVTPVVLVGGPFDGGEVSLDMVGRRQHRTDMMRFFFAEGHVDYVRGGFVDCKDGMKRVEYVYKEEK